MPRMGARRAKECERLPANTKLSTRFSLHASSAVSRCCFVPSPGQGEAAPAKTTHTRVLRRAASLQGTKESIVIQVSRH